MKKIIPLLLLVSLPVFGDTPFFPELQEALDVRGVKKTVHVIWNSSEQGSSTTNSGVYGLGKYLPSSSLIVRSYGWTEAAMTDAGTAEADAKVAFHCEDAANLKTAFTKLGGYEFIEGVPSGASTVMADNIADRCEIKATVTLDNFSAGKIHWYVEYVTLSD